MYRNRQRGWVFLGVLCGVLTFASCGSDAASGELEKEQMQENKESGIPETETDVSQAAGLTENRETESGEETGSQAETEDLEEVRKEAASDAVPAKVTYSPEEGSGRTGYCAYYDEDGDLQKSEREDGNVYEVEYLRDENGAKIYGMDYLGFYDRKSNKNQPLCAGSRSEGGGYDSVITYEYDDENRVISDSDGASYAYTDNSFTYSHTDEWGHTRKETSQFNEEGYRIYRLAEEFDEDGQQTMKFEESYELDEENHVLSCFRHDYSGESVTQYEYDENGNCIKEEYKSDGYESRDMYSYDENGRLLEAESYQDGELSTKAFLSYDEVGAILEEAIYVGTIELIREYSYDEAKRLTEVTFNGETEWLISYNAQGLPEKIERSARAADDRTTGSTNITYYDVMGYLGQLAGDWFSECDIEYGVTSYEY